MLKRPTIPSMRRNETHQPLCTIELIAEEHPLRCPGDECPYWENGCVLARVEEELDGRPQVAAFLLAIRRELEEAKSLEAEGAAPLLHR
jgi:hypothetical protein